MTLEESLIYYRKQIDKFLDETTINKSIDSLYNPIRYILNSEGKRIRALLTMIVVKVFGSRPDTALFAGASIEVLHNFTLVHDDIMDNADTRRGLPTIHKKWDRETAILSGDTMMGMAYNILLQTGNRDGFGIHSKSYYQKMLEALGDKAQLLVAKYGGKVIAGGIFVYLEEWGIYYYGASDHSYRKSMAPYLIQWHAIQEAKKRGCKFYDFLGIAPENTPNHPWAGVTDFKKKFGGQVVSYPQAKDMIIRPFWYWVYKMRKGI